MNATCSPLTAAVLGALALLASQADAATFVPLESTATYLHTYNDSPTPPPALALRLSDLGFAPGDRLFLHAQGDIDNGPGGDTFDFTMGVFSGSNLLLGNEQRDRVVDAITSDGPGFVSSVTYIGARPTDIPQDFGFNKTGTLVTVPVGAVFLFLAKSDQWYHDNTDPDHDYGVRVGLAPVPEPGTWALWLGGVAAIGTVLRRRRLTGAA
jgi:PEP-CTERM motif